MPQTLKFVNFAGNNIVAKTQLSVAVAANASSVTVSNNENFVQNLFCLIGPINSDASELLPIGAVTPGNAVPLTSNTVLQHNQFDRVYAVFGNQIKIYRAADSGQDQQPADSSFTPLDTVDIDPSEDGTLYSDATGGGQYWYKYTYFNPLNNLETDLGSSLAVRGSFTVNYCSLDDIRGEAGFRNTDYVLDADIDQKRQAAQDEINGALQEFYEVPLQPPINDYLRDLTSRLAAGLLRKKEFSQISDPQVNGTRKYEDAQKDLQKLVTKQRELLTKAGKTLAQPGGAGAIEGWPNSATKYAPGSEGGAPRVFRMSDIQGKPWGVDSQGNTIGNAFYGRKY